MKGKKLTYILSAVLAVALLPLVAAADIPHDAAYHSQSSVVTLRSQSPSQSQEQGQSQEQAKTFTGKVTKSNGRYVLEDLTMNSTCYLDDTKAAQKYDGKNVKVTGTLDAANNTIHVRVTPQFFFCASKGAPGAPGGDSQVWQTKGLREGVFGSVANKGLTGDFAEVWQIQDLA